MLDLDKERLQWWLEGYQLGFLRGFQEGLQEARQQGRRETAERLLRLALCTDEQVAEVTDLPIETVQAIKAENRH